MVDHESDLFTTTCDGVVSNGPTRLALNFIDLETTYDRGSRKTLWKALEKKKVRISPLVWRHKMERHMISPLQ